MPTIPPTITPAPTAPQRGDRNTFSARVDAFLTWLVGAVTQFGAVAENAYDNAVEATDAATTANSAVSAAQAQVDLAEELVALAADQATAAAASAGSALNAPGTSATSTTSRSIASGPVTLTIQAGKAFVVGQFVVAASAASPENYMAGQITAHNAGSGSLTINATQTNGSGTYADWSVAVAGAPGIGGATGDILFSENTLSAPDYLPCDGATYLKTSYPVLAAKIGTIGLFDDPIPVVSLPTGLTAAGSISATTWTPDGQYLVAAGQTLRAMKRSGETLVNITLAGGTSNTAYGAAFDKVDGTYLGEAGATSPYVKFHKRTGDTFSPLTNPASLPPGACTAIECSPDGVYWAVSTIASPYLVIYKRTGDTFAKLAAPATMPGSAVAGIAFSPDGLYLAVTIRTEAPYLRLYQRSGDVFTAISFPGVIPTGGDLADLKFSPTGRYLAARNANAYSRTVFIYDLANAWALASVSIANPSSSSNPTARLAWSADEKYLLVPDIASFELRDVTAGFAVLPTPPIGQGWTSVSTCGPSFSPDNMFLVFGGPSTLSLLWRRRYDPSTLFSTPRIVAGSKAYIKS